MDLEVKSNPHTYVGDYMSNSSKVGNTKPNTKKVSRADRVRAELTKAAERLTAHYGRKMTKREMLGT